MGRCVCIRLNICNASGLLPTVGELAVCCMSTCTSAFMHLRACVCALDAAERERVCVSVKSGACAK